VGDREQLAALLVEAQRSVLGEEQAPAFSTIRGCDDLVEVGPAEPGQAVSLQERGVVRRQQATEARVAPAPGRAAALRERTHEEEQPSLEVDEVTEVPVERRAGGSRGHRADDP